MEAVGAVEAWVWRGSGERVGGGAGATARGGARLWGLWWKAGCGGRREDEKGAHLWLAPT